MDRDELIQRTFPYLLKRLEDAGINATPQVDPQTNGYILTVDTMRFNVENLLSDLSRSDPALGCLHDRNSADARVLA